MIFVPSSVHPKCSSQLARRGLNKNAVFPVAGSKAVVLAALWPLQPWQEKTRFSGSSAASTSGKDVLGRIRRWAEASGCKAIFAAEARPLGHKTAHAAVQSLRHKPLLSTPFRASVC